MTTTLLSEKNQIVENLIANITKRTPSDLRNEGGFDFTKGSPNRAEIEGFAIQTDNTKKDIASVFDEERLKAMKVMAKVDNDPASKASGIMDITSDTDFTLIAGTSVMSIAQSKAVATVLFDVTFDGDPIPELKEVQIIANDAGEDVLFPIGDLFLTPTNLSGTNNETINNGSDEESNYELVQRIEEALLAIKEATVGAITAKTKAVKIFDGGGNIIEEILDVLLQTPWHFNPLPEVEDVGLIKLYILSSLGTASAEIIAAVELALLGATDEDGVQAAGMDIDVLDSPKQDIAFVVDGTVVLPGFTFEPDVRVNIQGAIADYVTALKMGQPINPTKWQTAAGAAEGVDHFDESTLTPATEQTLASFETWNITGYTITE